MDQFQAKDLEQSPQIKTRLDADTDKINAILAQLQDPGTFDPPRQSRSELEKAHQHMQESIKAMKLNDQPAQLVIRNQNSEVLSHQPKPFNG